jgi:hypothetical protein
MQRRLDNFERSRGLALPYCTDFTACCLLSDRAVLFHSSFGLSGLTNGVMLKDSLGRCRGTSERELIRRDDTYDDYAA